MVSSFFKTFSFAVLTPQISTFPCTPSASRAMNFVWGQYGRRAVFLYWEILSPEGCFGRGGIGQSGGRIPFF
jgi:hypothetical protein